jgi:hypothetical protein
MQPDINAVIDVVQGIARGFTKPSDDFLPVVLLRNGTEIQTLVASFRNDQEKRTLFDVKIPALVLKSVADAVFHIQSAWASARTPDEMEKNTSDPWRGLRPKDDPKRKEVVIITVATADGAKLYLGDILRTKTAPPMIGEIKETPGAQFGLMTHIITALEYNRSLTEGR